jgi:hypothetical protein
MNILKLIEIKDMLGVAEFDVVDSKVGKRSSVYAGDERIGLVREGLTAKDLVDNKDKVVAIMHEETGKWIFTIRSGEKL